MTNLTATDVTVWALPLLVAAALALTVTLTVRLRRRGRVRGVNARARLLARASLFGALRRLLGETYVVLSRDDIEDTEADPGTGSEVKGTVTTLQKLHLDAAAFTHAADGVDCFLIRKRDLAPVCAVALGDAPETPLNMPPSVPPSMPVVTLPLKRAYALQDVDAALSPVLDAPPPVTPESEPSNPEAEGDAGNAGITPSAHTPQRDAPRLQGALPTG